MIRDYANPAAEASFRRVLADPSLLPVRFRAGDAEIRGLPAPAAKPWKENGLLCARISCTPMTGLTVGAEMTFDPSHGAADLILTFTGWDRFVPRFGLPKKVKKKK